MCYTGDAAHKAANSVVQSANHSRASIACCRWEGRPIRADEWRQWFKSQAETAGKSIDNGLYVGLRLDGRVRASGTGCPPWGIFAMQLAPMSGMWAGIFDGMDGRVGG